MKRVRVKVPATSANLGPGFDVLGVALPLYNEVLMEASGVWTWSEHQPSLSIEIEGEGAEVLPRDASHLVVRAALLIFETVARWPSKLSLRMVNRIPLARGLGSSSAATLAGLCAANKLSGNRLSEQKILGLATALEGHPDNVVPAMLGGLCVAGVIDREIRYLKFPAPTALRAVVCIPERPLSTHEARSVLPRQVPLSDAVFTSSHVAFLLGALVQKKYEWLSFAMDDVLHQSARAALLPGLKEVIDEAKTAGAWGAALSGAGSSVLALSKPAKAKTVGVRMQQCLAKHGVKSQWIHLPLENKGVRYG